MTPLKMLNSFTHQHYKHDHCRLTLQLSNPLLTTSYYCISTITFDPAALFIGWPNIFILPLIHLQCDFIDVSVIEFCKYCSNNTILRITSSIRCHITVLHCYAVWVFTCTFVYCYAFYGLLIIVQTQFVINTYVSALFLYACVR